MRLTRLREDGGDRSLELHPRLTVVAGLGPSAYPDLAEAIRRCAAGTDGGVVKVLGPADVHARIAQETDPRVKRLEAGLAEATAAVEAIGRALEVVEAELRGVQVRREQVGTELTLLREELDPFAAAAVRTADALVERLSTELGAVPGTNLVDPVLAMRARVRDAEERLEAIRAGIEQAEIPDREGLETALEQAVAVLEGTPIPSPDALLLAEEWEALRARLAELEAEHAPEGGVAAVSDRVEQARARLVELLTGADQTSDEQIAALDAAHERVLAAERRLASADDDPMALAELEAATSAERALLVEAGFTSWSAYLMRADAASSERIAAARAELDEAEAQWEELVARLQDQEGCIDLFERLADCDERVRELVGPDPGDVAEALRAVRVQPSVLGLDEDAVTEALARALLAAGVTPEGGLPGRERLAALVEQARELLERSRDDDDERRRLRTAEEQTEAELEEARRLLEEMEDDPTIHPVELEDPRIAKATEAQRSARARLRRHNEAVSRITELVQVLDELEEHEDGLLAQLDAQQVLLTATRRLQVTAQESLDRAREQSNPARATFGRVDTDRHASAVAATIASAIEELTSGSPALAVLVVAGVLDGLGTSHLRDQLDTLAKAPDPVQVVVLTESPAARRWASSCPAEKASLAGA